MMNKGEITVELMYSVAYLQGNLRAILRTSGKSYLEEDIIIYFKKIVANGVS